MADNIAQQINDYVLASEDKIIAYKAPNLTKQIWQQHRNKKLTKYSAIAASVCLISLLFLSNNGNIIEDPSNLIAQNNQLELTLAKVSTFSLSDEQQQIVNRWQYELELLDQDIELHPNDQLSQNLWSNRTEILTRMIDFYIEPIELYEI